MKKEKPTLNEFENDIYKLVSMACLSANEENKEKLFKLVESFYPSLFHVQNKYIKLPKYFGVFKKDKKVSYRQTILKFKDGTEIDYYIEKI